jgi:hypothetical protein
MNAFDGCESVRFAEVPNHDAPRALPTGAVTLIQRFGSALNLNVHFHTLVLDGAYLVGTEPPVFRLIAPPCEEELQTICGDSGGATMRRR